MTEPRKGFDGSIEGAVAFGALANEQGVDFATIEHMLADAANDNQQFAMRAEVLGNRLEYLRQEWLKLVDGDEKKVKAEAEMRKVQSLYGALRDAHADISAYVQELLTLHGNYVDKNALPAPEQKM